MPNDGETKLVHPGWPSTRHPAQALCTSQGPDADEMSTEVKFGAAPETSVEHPKP